MAKTSGTSVPSAEESALLELAEIKKIERKSKSQLKL